MTPNHFSYLDLTFGAEEVFTVGLFPSITATLTDDEGKVIKQVSFSSVSVQTLPWPSVLSTTETGDFSGLLSCTLRGKKNYPNFHISF